MTKNLILILFMVSLLNGCAGYQPPTPVYGGNQSGASVYDPYRQSGDGRYDGRIPEPQSYPDQQVPIEPRSSVQPPVSEPIIASPAVVALMTEADRSTRAGDLDAAVATTERALRIQPRNAELVYKLAELRLKQEKPRLAEDLAKKANLLSAGNYELKKRSWLLIAHAQRKQGKHQAALEAERNARQY